MIILGIHDGHNSSAALIINGKLKCAVAEERFSRDKHQYGFPSKSVEVVLNQCGITKKDIDKVAMANSTFLLHIYIKKFNIYNKRLLERTKEYWYSKIYQNKSPKYLDVFKHRVNKKNLPYDLSLIRMKKMIKECWKLEWNMPLFLEIDKSKITLRSSYMSCILWLYDISLQK